MKLIYLILFITTYLGSSYTSYARTSELQTDSLSEVIVRGNKIGYSKLLKECYANFTKVTPINFKENFSGYSLLTRNDKLQFELNGIIQVDFKNYLTFNDFQIVSVPN